MLTERLNSLSLLMFEKELAEKLDSDEIINAFKAKPRRLALRAAQCAQVSGNMIVFYSAALLCNIKPSGHIIIHNHM